MKSRTISVINGLFDFMRGEVDDPQCKPREHPNAEHAKTTPQDDLAIDAEKSGDAVDHVVG
jgi:hypothetical protein